MNILMTINPVGSFDHSDLDFRNRNKAKEVLGGTGDFDWDDDEIKEVVAEGVSGFYLGYHLDN